MKSVIGLSLWLVLVGLGCGGEDSASPADSGEATESAAEGSGESEEGAESNAEAGDESTGEESSTGEGSEGSESGEESGEGTGEESAGTESSEEGAEGEESSSDEGGEESAEAGDEGGNALTVPTGTWLIWTDSPVCADSELMATRFGTAGYAVLTVDEAGAATLLFYDGSFETFREYAFPTVMTGTEDTYEVMVDESVEELEGSNCTINRVATLSLNASLGAWEGTLTYEEFKKGGGCFSDGCEGILEVKTQELGEPVNPLYVEGNFAFNYANELDGVEESGELVLYPVPEQPYFFELDIPTIGTSLLTIRGKKYIVGQGNQLWGRAVEYGFVDCPDVYSVDQWDVQLTVELGPSFGGSLVHTTTAYDTECVETTTEAFGTMVAP